MIYDSFSFERMALSIIQKKSPRQLRQQQEEYPLHSPKVMLMKNGTFEWQKELNSDVKCRCGHGRNNHLDGKSICLSTDPDPSFFDTFCLCEEFALASRPAGIVAAKTQAKIIQEKMKAREIS